MIKKMVMLLIAAASTACVTHEASNINAPKTTEDRIGTAIVSPLNDLNLFQPGIPSILSEAVKNPYLIPVDGSCQGLIDQVSLLNTALGPDLDALSDPAKKTEIEQGGEFAQNEAIGSVERTIQGVVPFRSWVRKLSGAEKRSKELNTAVAAGIVRRAFLKGMGQERGCAAPAAPLRLPVPAEAVKPDTAPAEDSTSH